MKKLVNSRTKTFLIVLSTILVFVSCNKILEVRPEGYVLTTENYYQNEEQLDIALRGIYAILAQAGLYGNNIICRLGSDADEAFLDFSVDRGTVGYYVVNATDSKILDYWRQCYKGVSMANLLLSKIDHLTFDLSEKKKNEVKGQALFLRGYFYFLLVTRFGGVPLIFEPVVSNSKDDIQIPRSSVKAVYDAILNDMETAEGLVSNINEVESPGRISKSAVWGILTRVCLYMAGHPLNETSRYTDATKWAEKVINSGHHQLNNSYQQVFINYAQDLYDAQESIWEVEFWGNGTGLYNNTYGVVGLRNGISYLGAFQPDYGYSTGSSRPTQWLFERYLDGDLRRDWAIAPYRYTATGLVYWTNTSNAIERFCGKFRRENETLTPKSSVGTPQNFPLLRYSDILLMYAEAINESSGGPTAAAYEALNQVRRRGYALSPNTPSPSVDVSGLSYASFKSYLKDERARELCFEQLRKDDLIRWGEFYKNMKNILLDIPTTGTISYITSSQMFYGNVAQRDTLWPLPSSEIALNKKLDQNPGW